MNKFKHISLPSIFGIIDHEKTSKIKNTNCVTIENIDAIDADHMDDFMRNVFDDIAWIDEEIRYNSKIVKLNKYHTKSILHSLNKKKDIYFLKNNILKQETVIISQFDNNKIRYINNFKCKVIDLKTFDEAKPISMKDTPYCFKLQNWSDEMNNGLTCSFQSNNQRHEWITHLDYLYENVNRNKKKKKLKTVTFEEQTPKMSTIKRQSAVTLMNDFLLLDATENKSEEFSRNFNFGTYLNYWELGYDNSVTAKYPDLKTELLNNKYYTLSKQQYYDLYKECRMHSTRDWTANDIGINNNKFNIMKGECITINHLIAIKVYSDYTKLQYEFKKHCRKRNHREPMKDFIARNSEIANWCRYLKECCTFYGKTMPKKMIVYTGLKNKLMFNSMMQHFECPISTTDDPNIANTFANGTTGVILVLKRANTKTRYFDVSILSEFPHEKEKLFMGSSLRIVDILINSKGSDNYISAIHMFEQIIDGQFIYIQGGKETKTDVESKLLLLIQCALKTLKKQEAPPAYVAELFMNLIKRMQHQNIKSELWINIRQLDKIKNQKLKHLLNGYGELFNHFNVNISNINSVEEYRWTIEKGQYEKLKNGKPREYIQSSQFHYSLSNGDKIQFHLECYGKYSEESQKCALFLLLDTLPDKIKEIKIAFDVLCHKKPQFRQLIPPQCLSKKTSYVGSQTFHCSNLKKNSSISWQIGLKVMETRYKLTTSNIRHPAKTQLKFDIKLITEALQNNDSTSVIDLCKALYAQNKQLLTQNQQLKRKLKIMNKKDKEIKKLKQHVAELKDNYSSETSSVTTPPLPLSPKLTDSASLNAENNNVEAIASNSISTKSSVKKNSKQNDYSFAVKQAKTTNNAISLKKNPKQKKNNNIKKEKRK